MPWAEPRRCTAKSANPSIPRLHFSKPPLTIADMEHTSDFHARGIDDDPRLLEQSYRLRHQVYCMERQFLDAAAHPDGRETDEFDEYSVHLGVVDSYGGLAATARLIKANRRGFPMFRYCGFFPEV